MKFSFKDFFSKCDQTRCFLRFKLTDAQIIEPSTKKFVLSVLILILKKHHKLLYCHNFELLASVSMKAFVSVLTTCSIFEIVDAFKIFQSSYMFIEGLSKFFKNNLKDRSKVLLQTTIRFFSRKTLPCALVCLEELWKFLNCFSLRALLTVIFGNEVLIFSIFDFLTFLPIGIMSYIKLLISILRMYHNLLRIWKIYAPST